MVAAIIKTVQTRVLASSDSDPTDATVNYDRWLFIETYVVIITASIPSIRSLFKSGISRQSTTRKAHELSFHYAAGSRNSGRSRGRGLSIDQKRIVHSNEGSEAGDGTWQRDEQEDVPESNCPRESGISCV